MSWFKDNIESMSAYVPGAQPSGRAVKLNQNENPYPPSPKVADVLADFPTDRLALYPDPMVEDFRRAVAEALDVPSDWVLPGDGSDDLIVMISRAALGRGRAMAIPTPTFPFYLTQAQIEGASVIEAACDEEFTLPVEALAEAQASVTFLANPNSPTGATADADRLDWLADRLDGLLVIDEAYADFAGGDAMAVLRRRENVILLRTLSKGYSLAGLRLGFGLAQPAVMRQLLKTKAIYNVGPIPAAVGAAALRDQAYHFACVQKILAQRDRLRDELNARSWRVWPSGGNFLMVRPSQGNARDVYEALKARGVLVRYFNQPIMSDKLRISIGTAEEIDALLAALNEIEG
jgi:histidinol-phosphate aminotransferase